MAKPKGPCQSEKEDIDTDVALYLAGAVREYSNKAYLADITVEVEGASFQANGFLLNAFSGFFQGLLASGMKESTEKHVNIKGLSKETFELVLQFICELKNVVNSNTFLDLWHASNMLQILPLKDKCEAFIKASISVNNCVEIYHSAVLQDVKSIEKLTWSFILTNFDAIKDSQDLVSLSVEDLKSLIEDDRLCTKSEDNVIQVILDWTSYVPVTPPDSESPSSRRDPSVQTLSPDKSDEEGLNTFYLTPKTNDFEVPKGTGVYDQAETNSNAAEHTDFQKSYPRAEFLYDLLAACRLLRVSGKCLMHLLSKNNMIKHTEEAKALVLKSIQWKLDGGCESSSTACTTWSLPRHKEKVETVVLWFDSGEMKGIRLNHDSVSFGDSAAAPVTATVWNDHVLWIHTNGNIYSKSLLVESDVDCVDDLCITTSGEGGMVAMGNKLYIIGFAAKSNAVTRASLLHIDIISLENGLTPVRNVSVAAKGSNIVIFGSEDTYLETGTTVVQCIDTLNDISYRMEVVVGSSKGLTIFENHDTIFFLYRTGALWKLKENPETGRLETRYVTMLWDLEKAVVGATIVKGELWVFVEGSQSTPTSWPVMVEGGFSVVRKFQAKGRHFLKANVSKTLLSPPQTPPPSP
ncbi:uncharacterized protein LOC101852753 [Aplysia californica]|uniref:Uncharacterized protein LOC101852753 n=1 Tax=Aplysia californica TaxID=6500 RepID=A0ABM0JF88_APLCA|nr:uncharacterized protein LOC101852753 [Aplysia californica]